MCDYKFSAFKSLDYEEFECLLNNRVADSNKKNLQDYILRNMPYKYYSFWEILTQKYFEITGDYFWIPGHAFENSGTQNNLYMKNKMCYEQTKKQLKTASVEFKYADIKTIPENQVLFMIFFICAYRLLKLGQAHKMGLRRQEALLL